MVKILSVVGARPQFVKLAPISRAFDGKLDHIVVHTGQHYDELLSDVFFRDLGIPAPDVNLAIGSASHGVQTGLMLEGLEPVFERYRPDWVLVYGDTNSTLAAAIAAVKLHIPLAHLEAGLRAYNRLMPEEHNRVLTDHASDLLLVPSETGMRNLAAEGLADRSVLVGDVMTDVLYATRETNAANGIGLPSGFTRGQYYVATIHRPVNTDTRERLSAIIDALSVLDHPVILPVHPRLAALAERHGIDLATGVIRPSDPLAYPQLVAAVEGSAGVVTDSGGLQKEAFLLRVPCTTIRTESEWAETVDLGWNQLVVGDVDGLAETVRTLKPLPTSANPYGDGHAAERVAELLLGSG